MTDLLPEEEQTLADEQRQLIDGLATSMSKLCHKVIAKRLEQFFEVIGREVKLMDGAPSEDSKRLMKFYSVDSMEALVQAQSRHVEKLQAKLPAMRDERPGYTPREG